MLVDVPADNGSFSGDATFVFVFGYADFMACRVRLYALSLFGLDFNRPVGANGDFAPIPPPKRNTLRLSFARLEKGLSSLDSLS